MRLFDESARLAVAGTADIAYVRDHFVRMSERAHSLVAAGQLPLATYALPDGTPMVPASHCALLDEVGGRPERIAEEFERRFLAAGGRPEAAAGEFAAWLTGGYGACLIDPSPEHIVAKDALMTAITALRACRRPDDDAWRGALRAAVDALDALELPFAAHDAVRFGGPSSRERLIAQTHRDTPELWR